MRKLEKYYKFEKKNGKIVGVNKDAFKLSDEAYNLFKELYNKHIGTIIEDKNLIEIHTGGWSENEELIRELKETVWWLKNHVITTTGGHYYFNTDKSQAKEWKVIKKIKK